MKNEFSVYQQIEKLGIEAAAKVLGLKVVTDACGLKKVLETFQLRTVIDAYGLEVFLEKYGTLLEDLIKTTGLKNFVDAYDYELLEKIYDAHSLEELFAIFGAKAMAELYGEEFDIYYYVTKYGIDKPIIQYNKGLITWEKMLKDLIQLERQLLNSEKPSNWSFGFAIDGPRLLIRTRFQKMVFILGTPDQHTSILEPIIENLFISNECTPLDHSKIPIVFSGAARVKIDKKSAAEVITEILKQLDPQEHVIVTGGYPEGIPHLAAKIAQEMGFEIIAIVPNVIKETAFDPNMYDTVIYEGEDWGDETNRFTAAAKSKNPQRGRVYIFGGGFFTELELWAGLAQKQDVRVVGGFPGIYPVMEIKRADIVEIIKTENNEYPVRAAK